MTTAAAAVTEAEVAVASASQAMARLNVQQGPVSITAVSQTICETSGSMTVRIVYFAERAQGSLLLAILDEFTAHVLHHADHIRR